MRSNSFATRKPGQPNVQRWGMTTISYTDPDALLSLLRQVEIQVPLVVVKDLNEWVRGCLGFMMQLVKNQIVNILSSFEMLSISEGLLWIVVALKNQRWMQFFKGQYSPFSRDGISVRQRERWQHDPGQQDQYGSQGLVWKAVIHGDCLGYMRLWFRNGSWVRFQKHLWEVSIRTKIVKNYCHQGHIWNTPAVWKRGRRSLFEAVYVLGCSEGDSLFECSYFDSHSAGRLVDPAGRDEGGDWRGFCFCPTEINRKISIRNRTPGQRRGQPAVIRWRQSVAAEWRRVPATGSSGETGGADAGRQPAALAAKAVAGCLTLTRPIDADNGLQRTPDTQRGSRSLPEGWSPEVAASARGCPGVAAPAMGWSPFSTLRLSSAPSKCSRSHVSSSLSRSGIRLRILNSPMELSGVDEGGGGSRPSHSRFKSVTF
ncbi:hypothetical protein LXL04_014420 [Taraxacum kok-saghyz]